MAAVSAGKTNTQKDLCSKKTPVLTCLIAATKT
jgi:hypothetical protein